MINNIDNIINYITESNYFIVTSHVSPDGDNLGSTISMYYFLKGLKKEVYYVLDDTIPLNLRFLTKDINILTSDKVNLDDYALITLDCGDENRICVSDNIKDSASKLICIDHHASNNSYGDFNYVDSGASSTCELVYNLLVRYNERFNKNVITEDIATCLYTGLSTDTGNFIYSNTNPSSFDMAKQLLIQGARRNNIVQNVFQSNTFNYYRLLGDALNTLDVVESKVAVICITKEMLMDNDISFNDVDGITSYTRDIKDVEVGILIKEKEENEIKVSLRSKNYVDVSQVAKEFGGGGHVRAAGCTVYDSVENTKEKVLEAVLKSI